MSDQESIQSEQNLNETLEIQENLDTLILEGLEAIEGLDELRALADQIELPELEEEETPAENESETSADTTNTSTTTSSATSTTMSTATSTRATLRERPAPLTCRSLAMTSIALRRDSARTRRRHSRPPTTWSAVHLAPHASATTTPH